MPKKNNLYSSKRAIGKLMIIGIIGLLLFVALIGGAYYLTVNTLRTGQVAIIPTPTATPMITPSPFPPSFTPTPSPSPYSITTPTTQPQSPTATPATPSPKPTETVTASPSTAPTVTPTLVPTKPPIIWKPVDLSQAVVDGLVAATVSGNGLQRIDITLRSKSNEPLEVTIRSGTLFQSQSAGVQNMVVIAPKVVYLESPDAVVSAVLEVACASMELDQPRSTNAFSLGGSIQADLTLLLNTPSFAGETFRVKQFAIWTITDNPPRDGYVGLGTGVIGSGPSDAEIVRIRTLFVTAGISTDKYRALA